MEIVKKFLGIIGVFKFTKVSYEGDKDIITGCILYLVTLFLIGWFIITLF